MATANLHLDGYRFYENDNSDVDACTAIALENTNISRETGTANAFMLRLALSNDSAGANFNDVVQLEFSYDGGAWTSVTTTSSYVRAYDGLPTDGVNCDTQILTSGVGTFDADGTYSETGTSAAASPIAKGNFFEPQWCIYLVDADTQAGKVVAFRHQTPDNETWTEEPQVTVTKPAQSAAITAAASAVVASTITVAAAAASIALTPVAIALAAPTISADFPAQSFEVTAASVALPAPDLAVATSVSFELTPATITTPAPDLQPVAGAASVSVTPAAVAVPVPTIAVEVESVSPEPDPGSLALIPKRPATCS
jgi:hypothetical protein